MLFDFLTPSETDRDPASPSYVGMQAQILKDPAFWDHFQHVVRLRSWKCQFPPDLLTKDIEQDARLYSNDTIFRKRRKAVVQWLKNDTEWAELVLGACLEISEDREGPYSRRIEDISLMGALSDFVQHLNCFGIVAMVMASRGRDVRPLSQDSSRVHDLDKLDPVMLVGYSEKFDDSVDTSVWKECVGRHTHVNPHHQVHPMWHGVDQVNCTALFPVVTEMGLAEMICDKVSRRLQKELGGVVSEAMWDVDLGYFNGLPRYWLDKAMAIIKDMKKSNSVPH